MYLAPPRCLNQKSQDTVEASGSASRGGFRRRAAALLAGAGFLLAAAGCGTAPDVERIVRETNASMLASQLGTLPQAGNTPAGQSPEQVNAQIAAFIESHPDQPALTAPLRIRQAMLFLATNKLELARAAFSSVEKADLHTARDLALKRHADLLLWWFSKSTAHTWSPEDKAQAQAALAALKSEQNDLASSPDIRDYLAEMRAWIGLTVTKHESLAAEQRRYLEDALDVYAGIFSESELRAFTASGTELPGLKALTSAARRRLRAGAVLERARAINREGNLAAQPKNPTFRQLVAP